MFWTVGPSPTPVNLEQLAGERGSIMTRFSTGLSVRRRSIPSIRVAPRECGDSSDHTHRYVGRHAFPEDSIVSVPYRAPLPVSDLCAESTIISRQCECCCLFTKGFIRELDQHTWSDHPLLDYITRKGQGRRVGVSKHDVIILSWGLKSQ
jgi:hypothetical protein